jgi:tetratricopeptide (TPR) repeat protein
MAVFQLVFGLTVFALTRQYYVSGPPKASTAAGQPAGQQPSATAAGTPAGASARASARASADASADDLAALIASFPGPTLAQDPAELSRQGDQYFAAQQYEQAAAMYERALLAGSRDVNDYNSLGLTLHYLGRSAEALQVLNEGVALDSTYQRIWLTLGFVNHQLGNTGPSREALSTAVQMGPDNEIGQSAAKMLQEVGSEQDVGSE